MFSVLYSTLFCSGKLVIFHKVAGTHFEDTVATIAVQFVHWNMESPSLCFTLHTEIRPRTDPRFFHGNMLLTKFVLNKT